MEKELTSKIKDTIGILRRAANELQSIQDIEFINANGELAEIKIKL